MIFQVLQEVNRQGVTILLVEQNVKQTLAIEDRAYVLEHGKVSMQGAGRDLLNDPHVKAAYLGNVIDWNAGRVERLKEGATAKRLSVLLPSFPLTVLHCLEVRYVRI